MKTVLLDLGNVVLGIDFRRVFSSWAESSGVDARVFYDGWSLDDAYEQHEIGAIDFNAYTRHLSALLDVEMSDDEWARGWNDLWTEPFHQVIRLLPELQRTYRLFAFTNTNDTHAACWRDQYGTLLTPFEEIFVSSEIGVRKPSPEAYLDVCQRMATHPEDVFFVDDNRENIEGANVAGLKAHHASGEAEVLAVLERLLAN